MVGSVLNALFGCSHDKITFPMTPGRAFSTTSLGAHCRGTYVVCLDCGKEFQYDWSEMRVGEPISTAGLTLRDLEAVSAKAQKAIEDLYYAESPVSA